MKKYIALLTTLLVSLFAINSFAWSPPPPPINGGYVVDLSNKLTQTQISQLNRKVEAVNQSTKNEMGALILASMDGENIEDVAQATFRAWGLGKKGLDNGVLVVISVAERKSRIQTGKGVEGDLPDLKCNDILKLNLNPNLKRGDFYSGLDATFSAISSTVESRHQAVTAKPIVQDKDHPRSAVGGCSVSNAGILSDNTNARGIILLALTMSTFFGLLLYNMLRRAALREREQARIERELVEQEDMRVRLENERRAQADRVAFADLCSRRDEDDEHDRVTTKMPAVKPAPVKKTATRKKTVAVKKETVTPTVVASVATVAAATLLESQEKDAVAAKLRAEKDAAESRARRKRQEDEQAEADRRRRDEDSRSSYSSSSYSSSSSDYGSSSGGGYDSGGSGFGGGDSGGGGASSDW